MKIFVMILLSGICFLSMNGFGQCIKGDCVNGQGTMTYPDGSIYEGQFKNGRRHGQGTMRFSDGGNMTGQWKDGHFEGQGTMNYSYGQYEGQWKDGMKNGPGTLTYSDGSQYEGEWKDDRRDGQGTMIYHNGKKYVGEWKDSWRDGQGTMTYSNGARYIGQWKDNRKDGEGIMIYPAGEEYVGQWKFGMKNGHGVMTFSDGSQYKGQWKDGLTHGQGIMILADGTRYEGQWENGRFTEDQENSSGDAPGESETAEASFKEPENKAEAAIPQQMREERKVPTVPDTYPYTIQVCSCQDREKAETLAMNLIEEGAPAFLCPAQVPGKGDFYRVFVGSYRSLEETRKAALKLKMKKNIKPLEARMPYAIQVGTFDSDQERTKMETELRSKAYLSYIIPDVLDRNRVRVLIGAFRTQEAAVWLTKKLQDEGFGARVVER